MSKNNTTSAILQCSVHCISASLASLGRHAQLTRCFSAVAELLVRSLKSRQGIDSVLLHYYNVVGFRYGNFERKSEHLRFREPHCHLTPPV